MEQINAIPGAVLVSIHQNCYPATGPWGAQVLYGPLESSRVWESGFTVNCGPAGPGKPAGSGAGG